MKIKLLLVDDQPVYLDGLRSTLAEDDIEVVGEAHNGEEALAMLSQQEADVVLLDINMPVMDGLTAAPLIMERFPTTEIIMLTVSDDIRIIMKFFHMNIAGYLLKEATGKEILTAVRSVGNGNIHYGENVMKMIRDMLQKKRMVSDPIITLTKRESEVLDLIVQGFTSQESARILEISPMTINEYRKNLLTKFEVRNTAGLVREAIRLDFVDPYKF